MSPDAKSILSKAAEILRPDLERDAELRALERLYLAATCDTCGQPKCPDCGLPLPDKTAWRDSIFAKHREKRRAKDAPTAT